MNNKPKQLGLNVSVFENFIEENRIYIDKTKIIYELITAPNIKHFYFVSRPRRFGKSLFISTLKEIFAGKKELFGEYWIGKKSTYNWPQHPVIHLDFGGIAHGNAEEFKQSFCFALQRIARHYALEKLEGINVGDMLTELVETLSKKSKVVLLIDEYDKPLVDHIDHLSLAEENRKILSNFYTTVKSLEAHWRAIFITGVSKFTRTSLFSGLNNLRELTFDPIAAELFGYTYQELMTYLSPHIDDLAKHLDKTREETLEQLKLWYNGYRFSKDMKKSPEIFTLDYPNREVRESFKDYLMQAFAYATPDVIEMALVQMRSALKFKDFEKFCQAVKYLFSGIPYNLHINQEAYYHSLVHFMFDMLGMRVQSEVATSRGRSDLVLETTDSIIVFEFKYDKSAQEALDQIFEKKYHEKYMHRGKSIILVGIDFNFKNKELTLEWIQHSL